MDIKGVNSYNSALYENSSTYRINGQEPAADKAAETTGPYPFDKYNTEGAQATIVSQSEREFFIKMFPENQDQLQKHELFNRNGRLQTSNISKGMLVDGLV